MVEVLGASARASVGIACDDVGAEGRWALERFRGRELAVALVAQQVAVRRKGSAGERVQASARAAAQVAQPVLFHVPAAIVVLCEVAMSRPGLDEATQAESGRCGGSVRAMWKSDRFLKMTLPPKPLSVVNPTITN